MLNIWTNEYNPFQKWKVLAWYERLLAIKKNKFMAPVNIALDIIQGTKENKKCGSFSCNFCMSDLEDIGKEAYVPEDILMSLPIFYNDWGVKSLCIAGHNSDPLMYNNKVLNKFLNLCHYYSIDIGLVSNGAYYNDTLIETVSRTCTWSGWSVNSGKNKTHSIITNTKEGMFEKIIENIKKMADYRDRHNLNHTIGYKFLITDDNYDEILDAVELASKIGVNHFQIRPTELPLERSSKIKIDVVESQIKESLKFEVKNKFEVFGIREKFTNNFTKKTPCRCIASPLGSTWKADGDIVICPDRRWSAHKYKLGNFIEEGISVIRDKWGGKEHLDMINNINKNIESCIRCTSYSWHEIYEKCIEKDDLNITLI